VLILRIIHTAETMLKSQSNTILALGWNRPRRIEGLAPETGPGPSILRKAAAKASRPLLRSRCRFVPACVSLTDTPASNPAGGFCQQNRSGTKLRGGSRKRGNGKERLGRDFFAAALQAEFTEKFILLQLRSLAQ
jgi:hypothetical protein